MKFKRKTKLASGLLLLLGVLCMATVIVAAGSILSNMYQSSSHPIAQNPITLNAYNSQGTGTYWDGSNGIYYENQEYYNGVQATMNGWYSPYHLDIVFNDGSTPMNSTNWITSATINNGIGVASIGITYDSAARTWYTSPITPANGTEVDKFNFDLTPLGTGSSVSMIVKAVSGDYDLNSTLDLDSL